MGNIIKQILNEAYKSKQEQNETIIQYILAVIGETLDTDGMSELQKKIKIYGNDITDN